jgi:4-hydroxybenzoate polyprenyltransferase
MSWLVPLIQTMRPKQWVKNGLLFIGLVFDGQLFNLPILARTLAAVGLFCLLSSLVYIINDLTDLEGDRNHPQKRLRPLPSGKLSARRARLAAVVLAFFVFSLSFLLCWQFGLVALAYFGLNLAYSRWLKHIPILDVMVLATFYVLRVGAGVVVIVVSSFSPWLYVFTTFMALFLGIGKRRAELALLASEANAHRRVLEGYTLPLLDQLMTIVTSGAIITYSLYTFWAPGLPENHVMMLTIPFVIFGVFRYLHLVHVGQHGGAPEDVLFSDRPLQVDLLAWGLSVVLIFYLL